MQVKKVTYITYMSLVLSAITFLIGLYLSDMTWVITSIYGLIVLALPYKFTKDRNAGYCTKISFPLPFILLAFILLTVVFKKDMGMFEEMWPASIVIQAWSLMIYGYMTLIIVNNQCTSVISRRWLLLYSMLIPSAIAAIYSFYIFAVMADLGFPIYNEDYASGSDNRLYNWYLMAQMTITFFFTLVYGTFLKFYLKKVPKDILTSYDGGQK